jgi:hypothetical protein
MQSSNDQYGFKKNQMAQQHQLSSLLYRSREVVDHYQQQSRVPYTCADINFRMVIGGHKEILSLSLFGKIGRG